jgi:hypothetical protein
MSLLYTSCVLGLRLFALSNNIELLFYFAPTS